MKRVTGILMIIFLLVCTINLPMNARAADPTIDGHGLMGDFFKCVPNPNNRTDITVFNFNDFRGSRAVSNLNGDSFGSIFNQFSGTPDYNTARFTGTIVPQYTEDYTFHMVGDDGFRLWINGQLIIDFWQQVWEQPQTSMSIPLEAGKHYDIKVEYLQGWGGSWLRMEWESASQKREIVPESALYLPADRMIVSKKGELTAEIQKLDTLASNFADKVTEQARNNLQEARTTAVELLKTLDGNAMNDRDKLDALIKGIEAVSIARSDFMKEIGVTSSTVQMQFNNPLYQGQDPFVMYKDGFYYFVSSSNLDSNNKVYVSKSRTLTDQGEKILVFDSQGTQTRIFAPEIYFFNGKWYIYYCADLKTYGYKHMATVLESVTDDPQGAYIDKGAIYAGEHGVYKQANDFTVFENKGKLYAVWGTLGEGEPVGPAIAPMDNPYTITADRSFLPGGGGEGPRVLQKDGKVFITVSEGDYASDGYRLSYFMNTDGNFLNPGSWTRKNNVFVSTDDVSGPARAGFVKSVDGTEDWMIYHSRVYQDTGRNWWRQVNIKKFGWNADGTPDFGQPVSPNERLDLPSGDLGQGDEYQAEDAIVLGDVTKDSSHLNYQGTGYIHLSKTTGAEANFVVNAAEDGDYIVGVRYAYGEQVDGESTNNPTIQLPARAKINVYVNGKHVKTIAPDKTAISWDEWFTTSERLALQKGKNVISYRIDDGCIGNVNVDYVTMYKADVPNVMEPNEFTGTLTGVSQVVSGSPFETSYGLAHVPASVSEAIYAQDVTFSYDPATFQFVSAESLKEGLMVVDVKNDVTGQVRILLASLGAGHSITTDGELLKLTWNAIKESSGSSITLSQAKLANAAGEERSLNAVTHNVQVTAYPSISGDANADGRVSVGDIAIVAANYGKNSSSPDWHLVQKLDINHDGVIDIADLAAIAGTIFQ